MTIQAWHITRWAPHIVSLSDLPDLVVRMRELSSRVTFPDQGMRRGQAVWGLDTHKETVGLGWDWVEILPHVRALLDPMHIVSNLLFVDRAGHCISPEQRVLHLNNILFQLQWQEASEHTFPRVDQLIAA